MRLLALHGWGQDAAVFGSKRTKDLQKKLKSLPLVLDCANAPFQIGETSAAASAWQSSSPPNAEPSGNA